MSRQRPIPYDLARRLVAYEVGDAPNIVHVADATDRVCQKLLEQLGPLIGATGFHALLDRAFRLAQAEFPELAAVMPVPRECLGLGIVLQSGGELNHAEAEEAFISVVSEFLTLLFDFMGWDLSSRIVDAAWPNLVTGEGPGRPGDG